MKALRERMGSLAAAALPKKQISRLARLLSRRRKEPKLYAPLDTM